MKKTVLALAILAALTSAASAAPRQTVTWPFSDSWLKNILVGTLVGCVTGAIIGSRTSWIGGAHAIAAGTAIGCGSGVFVGATLPHSRF